ncbi:MAG: hypothetical protein ABI629_12310 [bacterium]
MKRAQRILKTLVAIGAVMQLAACGAGGDGGSSSAPQQSTFERIQHEVFDVSCSADSCHSSIGQAGGLILEEGSSWDELMDHVPANRAAAAHGMRRVWPGDPARSYLIAKLTNNLAAGEGFPMPYNAAPLDAETIKVLQAWIDAGAPADGVVPGDDGRPLGNGSEDPTEVALPLPARGVQLKITARPVAKGSEETLCHYLKLPSDVDLDVNRIQINVTGGSHHIHLYRPYDKVDIPDHFEVCNMVVDFEKWSLVVASQLRKTDWELPEGVAFHFRAGEQLLVQTHFVNVGSLETSGEGKVVMNLQDADPGTITDHAGALFGQDRDVFVPALTNIAQSADCVFPKPLKMIAQTGHYHFRGKRFSTFRWDGGKRGVEIYHHEGYADPEFETYAPPLLFDTGQGLEWECYWENPNDVDYTFGPFTDINEHCNLFAFYYPTESLNESITCVKDQGVSTTLVRSSE